MPPSLPSTASNQKPLKLKNNKNSTKNKLQKMSQDQHFTKTMSSTITSEILANDNTSDREILSCSVKIGDFVLVKYKGKKNF